MGSLQNPWVKLKENIDEKDYEQINELQQLCVKHDQTALKLELEYKLGKSHNRTPSSNLQSIKEFMYFENERLIGYLGMDCFGGVGSPLEVNGMVHPNYRRQGIFKVLYEVMLNEWKRRDTVNMLLLSDRNSASGQAFMKAARAKYKFSEYEMVLKEEIQEDKPFDGLTLRKAMNGDAHEVAKQNSIYFNKEINPSNIILPEEEEKNGMIIYLAEQDQQIVGKVNLQMPSRIGGIYGLGVMPEFRNKGLGRAILKKSVEKLKELGAQEVILQVSAKNTRALRLYTSCGFVETSIMDYYELLK